MLKQIEFHFYLEAWMWCRQNNIQFDKRKMIRKDFKTWILDLSTQT